jgi:tetratricopeptide (TPR) repeat protein
MIEFGRKLRLAAVGLLLCAMGAPPARALDLFSKEDVRVQQANRAYEAGRYDEALRGYEDALRDHPGAPELEFDRGNALFKLGRQPEARESYLSALAAPSGTFKALDYYNMGNALWELGKNDEAANAYQRALLLDPSLEEARHNLELLLAPPPDAGSPPDAGGSDGGGDGGAGDGGDSRGDGGHSDGGSSKDGGSPPSPDAGAQQPPPADGGQGEPSEPQRPQDAGSGAKPQQLDKLQSEQLLDALRQREKNLQLWKFRMKQQHPKDAEKDW